MIEYPKIHTLYERDTDTHKVNPYRLSRSEFNNVRQWHVTEKIDGTNVRVHFEAGQVSYHGRIAASLLPKDLLQTLQELLPVVAFIRHPDLAAKTLTLFGEGYGAGIQKRGAEYRAMSQSFALFDVYADYKWLEPWEVHNTALSLGIETVPILLSDTFVRLPKSADDLEEYLPDRQSLLSLREGPGTAEAEGIVARASPLLFNREGERLLWKLKFRDFE